MTTRCPHSPSTAAPTASAVCVPLPAFCLWTRDGKIPKARDEDVTVKKKGIERHRWAHHPVPRGNYSFRIFFYHTMSCDFGDGVRMYFGKRASEYAQAQYDRPGWQGVDETAKRVGESSSVLVLFGSCYWNRRWACLANRVHRTGSRSFVSACMKAWVWIQEDEGY